MASCKQDVSDGVTCMVNGFVYDVESKLPIEGATVSVGNKVGVTNEEGYFVVSGVGAGTYDVGIVKAGYIPGKVAQLTVNPGFFREVRGEDLAYYRNQITADGGEDETRINVSGEYDVIVNPNTG
ncbi:MAG: carboxypeptidase regulatory-like domain-containing protein, partial [Spirochaetales bacterium]|nr:carboxypeptidase regulatory-like domain-containing protein [Spirochaetales bacterium]